MSCFVSAAPKTRWLGTHSPELPVEAALGHWQTGDGYSYWLCSSVCLVV